MRIAYVNTDEVNHDLAARTAAQHGAVIFGVAPEGPPPDARFDGVLYNLDDVPRVQRLPLLEALPHGQPHRPAAVHGYDITEEQVSTLKPNGVAAARRLCPGLLRDLLTAAREVRVSDQEDQAGHDLTWIDLAK